jgi:hypothetical protein
MEEVILRSVVMDNNPTEVVVTRAKIASIEEVNGLTNELCPVGQLRFVPNSVFGAIVEVDITNLYRRCNVNNSTKSSNNVF